MIWVVGDEQNLHFQMLFEILRRLGYEWAKDLYHLSYGMVNLPNGRMKSREGTVVDADDLFDEMSRLAREACRERGGEELSDAELAKRGEEIGLGALKFMLLKFNPRTTMIFDPAASLRFEGDTGPYVQYVAARISSIARKAAERGMKPEADTGEWALLGTAPEKELAVKLYFYPDTLRNAAAKRDCSGIADYLLDLAKAFNRFYRDCPILGCGDTKLAAARLKLALAVRTVIADALHTLTIATPEAM
jgi:arginyl-tRNA synthetase